MINSPSVLVIGGGISGLTAARELTKKGIKVTIWERAERIGGQILSVNYSGTTVELGASKIPNIPCPVKQLIDETSLTDQLELLPNEKYWVHANQQTIPIPESCTPNGLSSLNPVIRSPLLDWRSKFRGALEPLFIESPSVDDTSTFDFFSRRFGRRIADAIVAPVTWGLTGSFSEKQSLRCFSPELWELWHESKSILVQSLRHPVEVPNMCFLAGGLSRLVNAISEDLNIFLNCPAIKIQFNSNNSFTAVTGDREIQVNGVVLAVPDSEISRLLRDSVNYKGWPFDGTNDNSSTVLSLYEIDDRNIKEYGNDYILENPMNNKQIRMANIVGTNVKNGKSLLRVVGVSDPMDQNSLADTIHSSCVHAETLSNQSVSLIKTFVLPKTVVREEVGHKERISRLRKLLPNQIVLAGSYYDGGGLNSSIASGVAAAEQLSKLFN